YIIGEVKIYKDVYFSPINSVETCQGSTIYLKPNLWSSNGPVTYLWVYPDGNTTDQEYILIDSAQTYQSGTYSVTVTDTANCFLDANVDVTIYPNPLPEFAVSDTIFTDDPFDLDAGPGFSHYLWNTGDTTQYIWVDSEGWYSAEVESLEGCVGEDSSFVLFSTPLSLTKIYFPNAFTPNGDGQNDSFNAVTSTIDVNQFSLAIYNRWGALVYQTNDITVGWDGKYQGELCPSGAYVYKVSYNSSTILNAAPEVKMGTVMLVR
ncbi:MAG: gliding motility-associated C-terminal domain-containing protein, partial [Bacteroidota bacterium]